MSEQGSPHPRKDAVPYTSPRKRSTYHREYYATRAKKTPAKRASVENPVQAEKKRLVTFRLHESIIARCHRLKEEAITNGRYPWRTIGETYRGLIIKGLESMKGDPLVDEGLPYLALVKQVDGMRQPRIEAESILHNAQTEIQRLLSIDATREAQQFYATTLQIAEEMAPTVWRDWLLDRLRGEFPELERRSQVRTPGVTLRRKKVAIARGAKRRK